MREGLTLIAFWFLIPATFAQNALTGKQIYRTNCKAIVQIRTEEGFGAGFITSGDGIITTANHVVTTRGSRFRQYASHIEVFVAGRTQPYDAMPLSKTPSDEDINYDSTHVKVEASNLPQVKLGTWADVDLGDQITIIPSFPGFGCILLGGTVAGKGPVQTGLGPNRVNTIIFQSPIRNGFSGSPIFDSKGRVIGIEDTKVFGISPALDSLREKWQESGQSGGKVLVFGVDLAGSFTEVINNLDQNLISGLGSGVAIEYSKKRTTPTQASGKGR
ncbi:MAG: serine protease [Acidobacteriaceae bacterium]|nr:serine protease [Acidobacteriaceae bacterium]